MDAADLALLEIRDDLTDLEKVLLAEIRRLVEEGDKLQIENLALASELAGVGL